MKWQNAFLAALQRLSGYDCRGDTQNCHPTSAGISGTVRNMRQTPSRDVTQLLQRRALVQSNRNRDQAARYIRLHLILAKGR